MPTLPRRYPESISGLACTSCSKIAFLRSAKRVTRQIGKRNKDLEPSFAGNTDLGPAPGDYSTLENSRQNCTFLVLSERVQSKDSVFVL